MNEKEMLLIFKNILENIFDREITEISTNTIAKDFEDWDSLNHLQIIIAIEKYFKVKFTTNEIQSWKNLGDIINQINSK
jgi:acyl carrier protein